MLVGLFYREQGIISQLKLRDNRCPVSYKEGKFLWPLVLLLNQSTVLIFNFFTQKSNRFRRFVLHAVGHLCNREGYYLTHIVWINELISTFLPHTIRPTIYPQADIRHSSTHSNPLVGQINWYNRCA